MATTVDTTGSLLGRHDEYERTQDGFGVAFIDADEQRDAPRRHRFLHGGFEGTDTLFSFYLPPAEHYDGRLLQYLEGGAGGHENLLQSGTAWQHDLAYDDLGAVLVESNQGHGPNDGTGFHNDVWLFGASAESARFAKWLADRLYGSPVHHAYVFGASGGGHRSFQCIMRAPDVYDGAVPEVFGVNVAPYWSVMGRAITELGTDLAGIKDALEPGGSGDPFVGLTFSQREALRDLLQVGFPRRAMTQFGKLPVFPFTMHNTRVHNPAYYRDFWETPGYLGHDHPDRVQQHVRTFTTRITSVLTAGDAAAVPAMAMLTAGAAPTTVMAATIDIADAEPLFMADLTVTTGKAAGRTMIISNVLRHKLLLPFGETCPELFDGVEVGDEVEISNRDWVAFCHLYLHGAEWNVPGLHSDATRVPHEYSRFTVDGAPVHDQTGQALYDLDVVTPFPGKVIYIGCLADIFIWPTKITPFDRYVRSVFGEDADEHYRLWWVENSTHGPAAMAAMFSAERSMALWQTRLVDYDAVGAAAVRAVKAWCEEGDAPPPSSAYALTVDNDVVLPVHPGRRGGVQPAVDLTVGDADRIEVKVGTPVTFQAWAQVPDGAGTIVRAEMDFDHTDTWPFQAAVVDGTSTSVDLEITHTFDEPGTYFPSFRVSSHCDGPAGNGQPIRNLARVRVVVIA